MPREHHAGAESGWRAPTAWPSRTSPTVLNMALTGIAADVLHAGTAPALGLATGLLAVVTAGDPAAGALASGVTNRAAGSRMHICSAVCSSWRRSWPA